MNGLATAWEPYSVHKSGGWNRPGLGCGIRRGAGPSVSWSRDPPGVALGRVSLLGPPSCALATLSLCLSPLSKAHSPPPPISLLVTQVLPCCSRASDPQLAKKAVVGTKSGLGCLQGRWGGCCLLHPVLFPTRGRRGHLQPPLAWAGQGLCPPLPTPA